MINFKIIISAWLLLMTFKGGATSLLSKLGVNFKIIRGNFSIYTVEDVEAEDDLQYPRYDDESLEKVQQMWTNYYTCLQESENQDIKPEIRRLMAGQYTELECVFCAKPFQNYDELEWRYKPLSQDNDIQELEYLDLAHEMTLTENKTLRIFNAAEDFEGVYACYQKNNVISVYILEVSGDDTIEKVDSSDDEEEHFIKLDGNDFEISYQWTEWTECSSCGRVGRKYKYGTCYISSMEVSIENDTEINVEKLLSRRNIDIENFFRGKFFLKNSTLDDSNYENWGAQTIDKFLTGIPCASRYLPKAALTHTQKHIPMKVDVKYCLESCDKFELFEVFDANGNLIEVANNSAGIYSVLQKVPPLPPDIERRSVTAEFGKDITIQCPGTLLSTIPITWKINDEVLLPEVIGNVSRGRFIVDYVNRIHIKKLRLKDSHIYSCWQRNRLIGTVNLNVEKKFKIGFDHHVTLIGMIIILGVLLLIGMNIITGELKNRKK